MLSHSNVLATFKSILSCCDWRATVLYFLLQNSVKQQPACHAWFVVHCTSNKNQLFNKQKFSKLFYITSFLSIFYWSYMIYKLFSYTDMVYFLIIRMNTSTTLPFGLLVFHNARRIGHHISSIIVWYNTYVQITCKD